MINSKDLYTDKLSFAELKDISKKLGFESNFYKTNKEILNQLLNILILVKI